MSTPLFQDLPIGATFDYIYVQDGSRYVDSVKIGTDRWLAGKGGASKVGWYSEPRLITKSSHISRSKGSTMFKDLFTDLRAYLKDNRDLIFSVVLVLVLDEYVFAGAFRERLKGIIEGFLKKAESKTTRSVIDVTPTK